MTPRELGVITTQKDTTTKKKRIIEKNHGSFNLLGLMEKSKLAALNLSKDEQKNEEKASAKAALQKKAAQDMLDYQLCQRKCTCGPGECTWKHFSLCSLPDCGALVQPLSTCQSVSCVKQRREATKVAATAKAAQHAVRYADFVICQTTCKCPQDCVWRKYRICENPPCKTLLADGTNCRKRACAKFRKDNGIALQKPTVPPTSKRHAARRRAKTKPVGETSSAKQPVQISSEFEIENIVSGPCASKGPNKDKYEIKWLGYDSEENTWEPRANIPDEAMMEYDMQRQSSDSDDDTPIIAASLLHKTKPVKPLRNANTKKVVQTKSMKQAVQTSSSFEIENIVSGPCVSKGPNLGKYEIKWLNYDSVDNTWEPRAHIPDEVMMEYDNQRQSSDSDDDEPIAASLLRKTKVL